MNSKKYNVISNTTPIDERKGRKIASSKGLRIKGTLGILADAKRRGLIDDFKTNAYRLLCWKIISIMI
jgi:predicted nucleic acid-binding protein